MIVQGIFDDNAVLYDAAGSGRQIQLQNVSLVITYTGMVVAALMMAGFLYLALNFSGRRSGYGYGVWVMATDHVNIAMHFKLSLCLRYGHSYAEDDYFDGYYSKRETHKGKVGYEYGLKHST